MRARSGGRPAFWRASLLECWPSGVLTLAMSATFGDRWLWYLWCSTILGDTRWHSSGVKKPPKTGRLLFVRVTCDYASSLYITCSSRGFLSPSAPYREQRDTQCIYYYTCRNVYVYVLVLVLVLALKEYTPRLGLGLGPGPGPVLPHLQAPCRHACSQDCTIPTCWSMPFQKLSNL